MGRVEAAETALAATGKQPMLDCKHLFSPGIAGLALACGLLLTSVLSQAQTRSPAPPVISSTEVMTPELAEQRLREYEEQNLAMIRGQICDRPPFTELCSVLPRDNVEFSEFFEYIFILDEAQNPFDIFAWQSFIALNWPLDEDGQPAQSTIGTLVHAPRRWTQYSTPREIYAPDYIDPVCGKADEGSGAVIQTSTFLQPDGFPLIDSNLNYVVYDTRVNDVMEGYIRDNNLHTLAGQKAFSDAGRPLDFPMGFYEDPANRLGGKYGSTAIKSAWKIIDTSAGDDPSRYFTMAGRIAVAAQYSETGEPFCIHTELGLVGMHIMQRTQSGNGENWIWSTFEHVDNAPDAGNSRKPVDTLREELFDGGCQAPARVNRDYSFFNPQCKDCITNHLDKANWKWTLQRPHAKPYASQGKFGSQIVHCWKVFEGTQLVNQIWQEKLSGTVWANYQAYPAQWKGTNKSMLFPEGEVPRYLVNSSLESYDQAGPNSSCLGCHASARTLTGQFSAFSFLPAMVGRFDLNARLPMD